MPPRPIFLSTIFLSGSLFVAFFAHAQLPPQCPSAKVLGAESCAKCHGSEVATWQTTPHHQTFESLARDPRAQEITSKLGMTSVKRNDLCIRCHFTMQDQPDGKTRAISGISCESCHGAAKDWLALHNDYGGPGVTHDSESDTHRAERLARSEAAGMRNTRNLYLIASSCLNCHTVPEEQLVNVGGHKAGSESFDMVAWSQGLVRHNFVRSAGLRNAESPPERLRVMHVCGLLAELEFSTRATAKATEKAAFGLAVARRAAATATKLMELQAQLNDPLVQKALIAFASAELRTGNADQLNAVADQIAAAGLEFATQRDGATLAAVDAFLPAPETWKR